MSEFILKIVIYIKRVMQMEEKYISFKTLYKSIILISLINNIDKYSEIVSGWESNVHIIKSKVAQVEERYSLECFFF